MRKPEDFQAEIDAINLIASRTRPAPKPAPIILCYTPNGPCMGEHIRRLYSQKPDDCIGQRIDLFA